MDNNTENRSQNKIKLKKISILVSFLVVFVVIVFSVGVYGYNLNSNIEKVNPTNEELGLAENPQKEGEVDYKTFSSGERFINIALFGVDTRNLSDDTGTRADCIMILSIDRENKSIKLGSIVRDTYTNIEGYGMDKINHAYAYGGSTFMVKTLNQNFKMDISNFAVVNFGGLAKIIDRFGGVKIDIDEDEVEYINKYINEISKLEGVTPENITTPGVYNLNGIQAVAYTRIRYTAGGDFKRSERQREVLMELAKKGNTVNVSDIISIITDLSSNLKTTFDVNDMLSLSTEIIKGGYQANMEQEMFPEAEYSGGEMISDIYYYVTDLEKMKESMHNYFFGE